MINLETLEINIESDSQPQSSNLDSGRTIASEPEINNSVSAEIKSEEDNRSRSEIELWRSRYASMAVERELAIALSGESLLPGVAVQLIQLMRERVVTKFSDNNGLEVVSLDGRCVAESVKEWLKQPEFQHFRPAITRGGTASRTEAQVTERTIGDINKEKSLNEIVINQWRQRQNQPSAQIKPMWPKV
jgi:hypothetical protein